MSRAALPRIWAVLPAAGVGRRMGADIPKQYLDLLGRPIVGWTLDRLLGHPAVHAGVIALAADDPHWDALGYRHAKPLHRVVGGAERVDSVAAALTAMEAWAAPEDWVMVHDAVRPCVSTGELDRLAEQCPDASDGALLAMPVRDTLKRGDQNAIVECTVDRERLWHAFTPQLFPLAKLREALAAARANGVTVTDEAQAMELAGYRPRLVEAEATNIKVTRRADLGLAAAILHGEQSTAGTSCA